MAMRLDHGADELTEVHDINVTPFIDVMPMLLIIFMVAAPLATVDIAVNLLGFELIERAVDLLLLALGPLGPSLVVGPQSIFVTRQYRGVERPSAIACWRSATQRSRPLRGRSLRPLCWLSRYSQITGESKRSMSLTDRAGILPMGLCFSKSALR